MEEPTYKTDVFEGPLDLLLSLIYKNKIDICDIPISLIFDQYMEYLDVMRKMDMEIAGEFIVMASELMLIKSRMLLPKPQAEDEEDPRARLAAALLEYKRAKEIAARFDDLQKIYGDRMVKETDELPPEDNYVREHSVLLLQRAMRSLLEARSKQKAPEENTLIRPIIKRKVVPVSAKIISVMKYLIRHGKTHFDTFFENAATRSELVSTFMAILELVKANRVTIYETEHTGDDLTDVVIGINL